MGFLFLFFFFFVSMFNTCRLPGGSVVKNLLVNAGVADSTPGAERSPGVENGHQLQGNSVDRGA